MLHRYESKILLKSGNIKKASEIVVGDILMSSGGSSKVVDIKTHNSAYRIVTKNRQELFTSNNTVFNLVSTTTKLSEKCYPPTWTGKFSEYECKSKNFKHLYKIKLTGVNFKFKHDIVIDPYFLGILLGDGSIINGIKITTMDDKIVEECVKQAAVFNVNCSKYNEKNKSNTYRLHVDNYKNLKNPIIEELKKLDLFGTKCHNKFIPIKYKVASAECRKNILAGLIDTDGSKNSNTFDFISKSKQLTDDATFIARSLGLRVSQKECKKKSQNGTEGIDYRLNISGNTDIIPVRLNRKKCNPRKQKKDPTKVGFDIKETSGNFIEIITDGQYLDENFVIQY